MKALLRQTAILALIALALSHADKALAHTANSASAADHSSNLDELKSFEQSGSSEQARPLPAPVRWRGLIGEYGLDNSILYILEKDGRLCAFFKRAELEPLEEVSKNIFKFPALGTRAGQRLVFTRDAKGRATQIETGNVLYKRRQIGPEEGATQLRVKPLRPVSELMKEALAAEPPKESGQFRAPDLSELTKLDPTIKL